MNIGYFFIKIIYFINKKFVFFKLVNLLRWSKNYRKYEILLIIIKLLVDLTIVLLLKNDKKDNKYTATKLNVKIL